MTYAVGVPSLRFDKLTAGGRAVLVFFFVCAFPRVAQKSAHNDDWRGAILSHPANTIGPKSHLCIIRKAIWKSGKKFSITNANPYIPSPNPALKAP